MDAKIITMMCTTVLSLSISLAQEPHLADQIGEAEETHVVTSSRMLIGQQKEDWLDAMSQKVVVAKRVTGPFGMTQDPNIKITKLREQKVEKGAFLEAIAAIKINTVMPSNRLFISNAREFTVGDEFPIIKNQRQFDIEVVAISSKGIIFKNSATGEQVRKKLNALPVGMKKSSGLGTIPGVYAADAKNNRPLNLDDE